jgi:hypothetical protein
MDEASLDPGEVLGGDFEILRPLGAGGMGAVYLARQISTGSVRALKVMRARFASDPGFVRRFALEARAGAQIQSRHVVEVVQAGVDQARAMPWLAMEFLEGRPFDEAMAEFGVPGAEDAALLLEQLFHALGAAHDARLVHRDLKPPNLFLARSDSPRVPFVLKVLDFGIAKWLADVDRATTEHLATPLWGAPEQSVSGARIGPYTDVWALGLLVFWLVTGDTFFPSDQGLGVLQKAIHYDPIPLASLRAAELSSRATLGPDFDAWFSRCVAREPEARFADARDAGRALGHVKLVWPAGAPSWRPEAAARAATRTVPMSAPAGAQPTLHTPETEQPVANTAEPLVAPEPAGSVPAAKRKRTAPFFALGALLAAGLGFAARPVLRSTFGSAAPQPSARAALAVPPPDMLAVPALTPATAPFALDRVEVDARHYDACVAAGACTKSVYRGDEALPTVTGFAELCNAGHPERAEHPINCVDRAQARAYCHFAGKRLPSEAEWELAARGRDQRLYPWGNEALTSCDMAVVSGLCARKPEATRRVGSREANALSPFGLADMSGNVWEWVAEDSGSGGVLRGGGWDYPAERATVVSRLLVPATRADVSTGFRCALTLGAGP